MFTGDQSFTYDLGELGRYYLGCAALMERWRSMLPHGVTIDLSMRRSRADLGVQARAIVDRCGLELEDACLAFDKTRHVKVSRSVQVHEPIYRTSVGRGRQVRAFSSHG